MKVISSLLSLVLQWPAVGSDCTLTCSSEKGISQYALTDTPPASCNVEGQLFTLYAERTEGDTNTGTGTVDIKEIGDLGTDTVAHFFDDELTRTGIFYINKKNNRLITLNPFTFMRASPAYTDSPEGGELRFTFFNDTRRPNGYYWPKFEVVDRYLTADGRSDVFGYCPFRSEFWSTGTVIIGEPGEGCLPLKGLYVSPVTSVLSIE
ncbi:hypothetical protein BJY04DRAFT_151035 [Aspergillus karnatakaensis]|uniref:uncharacterized protein n=1 Tax=Aspergillus karnatakaensis TaxID=1810916 RepID=UPI003CCDC4ED